MRDDRPAAEGSGPEASRRSAGRSRRREGTTGPRRPLAPAWQRLLPTTSNTLSNRSTTPTVQGYDDAATPPVSSAFASGPARAAPGAHPAQAIQLGAGTRSRTIANGPSTEQPTSRAPSAVRTCLAAAHATSAPSPARLAAASPGARGARGGGGGGGGG